MKENKPTSLAVKPTQDTKNNEPTTVSPIKIINNNINSDRLEYQEIENYLGEPTRIDKDCSCWQCPICKDSGSDNLIYGKSKRILHCFSCHNNEGGKTVYKQIQSQKRGNNISYITPNKSTSDLLINQDTVEYYNKHLLDNEERLEILKSLRGINKETVRDLKIGFVKECNCWLIPNYDLSGNLIGYEFRTHDFKPSYKGTKSWRSKGEAKQLCKINNPVNPKNAIVLEGFLDSFVLYQYLNALNLHHEYQILTPSNGVGFIPELMQNFDHSRYQKVILFLDNDNQGKRALEETAQTVDYLIYELKFPYLDIYCKDFNDYYLTFRDQDNGELLEKVSSNPISLAKRYIKADELNHTYNIKIDEHLNIPKRIITYRNSYYEIGAENNILSYKRLSNFKVDFLSEIIKFDEQTNPYSLLEVQIISRNGRKSQKIMIDGKSKQEMKDFLNTINRMGTHATVMSSTHLAQIIDKIDSIQQVYCYENPGLVKGLGIWLYSNCAVDIRTGDIYRANAEGIIIIRDTKIKIDIQAERKSILKNSDKYNSQELAKKLADNLFDTYSGSIEPFIVIGTTIMAPFSDILKTRTNGGFPVCYLFGSAQSGKTSLAEVISAYYGFESDYIISGNSTDKALITNMGKMNRLPAIIDEYPVNKRDKTFEEFIKSIYEGISRELMKKDGINKVSKPINCSSIFISNYLPPNSPQIRSRMSFVTFNISKFNKDKAIEFNEIRNHHLSSLAPSILSTSEEWLLDTFDTSVAIISGINPNITGREINNFAVALTGIFLLIEKAGMSDRTDIIDSFIDYIKGYTENYQSETALDLFLSYLTTLKKEEKIECGKDYKFRTDGKLAIYLTKTLLLDFNKMYKLQTGNRPIEKEEILNAANNDIRVQKNEEQVTITVNLEGTSRKCLVIDVSQDEELQLLR